MPLRTHTHTCAPGECYCAPENTHTHTHTRLCKAPLHHTSAVLVYFRVSHCAPENTHTHTHTHTHLPLRDRQTDTHTHLPLRDRHTHTHTHTLCEAPLHHTSAVLVYFRVSLTVFTIRSSPHHHALLWQQTFKLKRKGEGRPASPIDVS